ncbi:MAG: M23 family metallopeptidase [Eggerthellaceae bacterium]|nr:M23 family metallopeptidase [Eggerthellaceae bacterium]
MKVAALLAAVVLVGLGASAAYLVFGQVPSMDAESQAPTEQAGASDQSFTPTADDLRILDAIRAGASATDPDALYLPTPLIATCNGLNIHSPILPRELTEIEFHQASYDDALPLTPLLTIVDADTVEENHGTKHIPWQDQPYGDAPLVGEAVSTERLDSDGPDMACADVGAKAGTYVYAPITGTVVNIKTYSLYGLLDDYELHIQSPDHPELDVVVLHITDLMVKVGDQVYGGCTRIAHVRDIGELVDSNLMNFTMPPDPGNHCHVQVNNAAYPNYQGLVGALDIFDGKGYAR